MSSGPKNASESSLSHLAERRQSEESDHDDGSPRSFRVREVAEEAAKAVTLDRPSGRATGAVGAPAGPAVTPGRLRLTGGWPALCGGPALRRRRCLGRRAEGGTPADPGRV